MTRDWNPEEEYIGGGEEAGRVGGSGGDNQEQNYRNPNQMEMDPSFDEADPQRKRSRTTHPSRFKVTRDWNLEDEYIGGGEEAGGSGGDNQEQNYRNQMEMDLSFDDPQHKRSRTTHPPQQNLIEIVKGNGDLIPTAVKIWVERYEDSRRLATAELLSMLFEACGTKYSIKEELLDETDVDDVVIALVNLARAGEIEDHHSSRKKELNNFRGNLASFWNNLTVECQNGPLFDKVLFDKCMDYIIALSCTPPRVYRQTATLMGLQLVTSFIFVANALGSQRETTQRQLKAEIKKGADGPLVERLSKRLSVTHEQITTLEDMMRKILTGLFVHRYRDIDPEIRASCIQSLGIWTLSYPSLFLQDMYLKYLGWTLNDKTAGVRTASLLALQKLYEMDENLPTLGLFTERYTHRTIEMAGDVDMSAAVCAIALVKQLLRHQLIPDDDPGPLYDLLIDQPQEIRHAVGELVYDHLIAHSSPGLAGHDDSHPEIHIFRLLQILREFSIDPTLSVYGIDDIWAFMKEMFEHKRKDIAVSKMKNYPQPLRKFMADKTKVPSLVEIIMFMKLELYSLKRQEQNFKAAVRLIKDAYFKHWEREALRSCVKAVTFSTSESKGVRLKDELLDKLTSAIKDGNEEYSHLVNLKRLYELQLSQPVLVESIYDEIHNVRNLDQEVICFLLLNMHMYLLWSLHSITSVSQDSLSSLVSKRNQLAFRVSAVLAEIVGYCPDNVPLRKLCEQIFNPSDEADEEAENKEYVEETNRDVAAATALISGDVVTKIQSCWDISSLKSLPTRLFWKIEERLPRVGATFRELKRHIEKSDDTTVSSDEVVDIFGVAVSKEFENDQPEDGIINCLIHENNNCLLHWKSATRAVELAPGTTHQIWGNANISGPVRNQKDHSLCAAYAVADSVSAAKAIEYKTPYQMLSVKEICFFADPAQRKERKGLAHQCHPMHMKDVFKYVKDHGIGIQEGEDDFDCITDIPSEEGEKIKIKGSQFLGDKMKDILARLKIQALVATVVVFDPEYYSAVDNGEVYFGPTSKSSKLVDFHGVLVLYPFSIGGEIVFRCKSSQGERGKGKGYIDISGTTMLLGCRWIGGGSTLGYFKEYDPEADEPQDAPKNYDPICLKVATPLLCDFMCPLFDSYETTERSDPFEKGKGKGKGRGESSDAAEKGQGRGKRQRRR